MLVSPADVAGGPTPFRGPLLPSQRWELTAAEAFFLRYFDCDPNREEVSSTSSVTPTARRWARWGVTWPRAYLQGAGAAVLRAARAYPALAQLAGASQPRRAGSTGSMSPSPWSTRPSRAGNS